MIVDHKKKYRPLLWLRECYDIVLCILNRRRRIERFLCLLNSQKVDSLPPFTNKGPTISYILYYYYFICIVKVGVFCDTDPSSRRILLYGPILDHEDGSVSQNTPTLTKNLSNSSTYTWTFR